ncbi:MAG: imidazole glycerol phosphate synthase subunit HisH [Pseudomonadota bacterium]
MAERVVIVDYGSGNLRSAQKAVERTAREAGRAVAVSVTREADDIAAADRVILPGVGAFAACKAGLDALPGAVEALEHAVLVAARPFLGICVGMQLLADRGLEFGDTPGLGWIAGSVRALEPSDPSLRLPHIGWNAAAGDAASPFDGVFSARRDFYFVHSYHFDADNDAHVIARCDYGGPFAAAVRRDTILGVQFHPEKSQAAGRALLDAFLAWRP